GGGVGGRHSRGGVGGGPPPGGGNFWEMGAPDPPPKRLLLCGGRRGGGRGGVVLPADMSWGASRLLVSGSDPAEASLRAFSTSSRGPTMATWPSFRKRILAAADRA